MTSNNKNYSILSVGEFSKFSDKGRKEIGEELGLTGSEILVNSLPTNASIPFIHSHKLNEEVYVIVQGEGEFMVDGEEFTIKEGSVIRVAPEGERVLKAGDNGLVYICIQTQKDSLQQATHEDGVMHESKASWM
ncbi:MAG: cupin domain-containing protein [Coprobacillaceae bacterium]